MVYMSGMFKGESVYFKMNKASRPTLDTFTRYIPGGADQAYKRDAYIPLLHPEGTFLPPGQSLYSDELIKLSDSDKVLNRVHNVTVLFTTFSMRYKNSSNVANDNAMLASSHSLMLQLYRVGTGGGDFKVKVEIKLSRMPSKNIQVRLVSTYPVASGPDIGQSF